MNKIAEIKVSYNATHVKKKISSSVTAFELLLENWDEGTIELHEEFKVLILNNANEVLGIYTLSKGGITGTVVDVRILFSVALKCHATGIILCHNHPSGTLTPSDADRLITKKVKQAAEFLDVKLLDHLIITKFGYLSFADDGLLD
jgi:DNA repair protein RadC